MRILILTPAVFPALSGNAMTTERWRRSLAERGLTVEVLCSFELEPAAFLERLRSFRPDIVHVYHAYKSGALLLNPLLSRAGLSFAIVVSPGGTDINLDLGDPERRHAIIKVLDAANLVVAQSAEIVRAISRLIPELTPKILTVPKATCWFGDEPLDLRKVTGCEPNHILFLLPAGIRPVKGNLACLLALERVHLARNHIRFAAAGPLIDAEYAARFDREVKRLGTFARWIPSIPPAAMRFAYASSDIVLNASLSEGLSNSLLEALAAGRPFLASDIPGNRQTVLWDSQNGQAGMFFDPHYPDDFLRKALELVDNGDLRKRLGDAARLQHLSLPTPDDEAEGLIAGYLRVLGKDPH